jgi:hypothetical protein
MSMSNVFVHIAVLDMIRNDIDVLLVLVLDISVPMQYVHDVYMGI